jgi:hypothetical protein
MKRIRLFMVFSALLVLISFTGAMAAGYVDPANQDCQCDTLIRSGIKPDPLNRLAHILSLVDLTPYLDKLAVEVRAILNQFGVNSLEKGQDREAENTRAWDYKKPLIS